ncbi:chorismate lyase [Pseudoalteromonas ruthenica]|uniref:chorismate--pyruvate lyase family protein n=1 Tax=Pseudoalteromonas ruthenica TaxID=151081 RepID=UPI0011091DD1|nr:chorismate lyase [Pseudoalteromonas ruthenica]TLX50057.1 chorismate lyase [Pseudoalteromonas ruthenica]
MPAHPIPLRAQWISIEHAKVTDTLADWLLESGSLTKRLKSQCQQFAVEVLSEKVVASRFCDHAVFKPPSTNVRVREVLLFCDNEPMVYAQTWLPEQQSQQGVDLAHLGNNPLGEVIFQDPQIQRVGMEVADFAHNQSLSELTHSLKLPGGPLWGRRSCFNLTDQQIMVCEIFLPGAYPYL